MWVVSRSVCVPHHSEGESALRGGASTQAISHFCTYATNRLRIGDFVSSSYWFSYVVSHWCRVWCMHGSPAFRLQVFSPCSLRQSIRSTRCRSILPSTSALWCGIASVDVVCVLVGGCVCYTAEEPLWGNGSDVGVASEALDRVVG